MYIYAKVELENVITKGKTYLLVTELKDGMVVIKAKNGKNTKLPVTNFIYDNFCEEDENPDWVKILVDDMNNSEQLVFPKITNLGVDLSVCAYCMCSINDTTMTIDHVTPKSRGGVLSNDNKLPVCKKCNLLKGDMNIVEFNRSINSMLFLEQRQHQEAISYLKKIRMNVVKIIEKRKQFK